jgi:septal ring factor EnvC (AmiA/AmiB activator)
MLLEPSKLGQTPAGWRQKQRSAALAAKAGSLKELIAALEGTKDRAADAAAAEQQDNGR